MGSYQNYGPFWGTLNNRCRVIIGTPKRDHNFDNHPYAPQTMQSLVIADLSPKLSAHESSLNPRPVSGARAPRIRNLYEP